MFGAAMLGACSGGGDGGSGAPSSAAVKPGQVSGVAFGGRFPIVGSTITLYAVGSSGYGGATALTPTDTTLHNVTDNGGNWSINFNCPAADTPIYAVASGGHSGSNSVNGGIVLSSLLGVCGDAGTPLPAKVDIDEVTTVASAYALNQFLSADGVQPGSPLSNVTGRNNAIATLANLADVVDGTAVSTLVNGASGTPPTATLNTLANILESCVDSSGPASDACTALFNAAKPAGGAAPTTTLQAILDIARNPGSNVAAIYGLLPANGPFGTSATNLGAAPNDWTLALSVTGAGLSNIAALAVDGSGNVWAANGNSTAALNSGHGSISKLSPQGVSLATGGVAFAPTGSGVNGPQALTIDNAGNVWIGNGGGNSNKGSVTELDNNGNQLSPVNGYVTGINTPTALATDAAGDVWIGNGIGSVVRLLKGGASYTAATFTGLGANHSLSGLAIDSTGSVWLSDHAASRVVELDSSGAAVGSPISGGGLSTPGGVAIDAAGHVWVVDEFSDNSVNGGNGGLSEFAGSGAVLSPSLGYPGGGLYQPAALAVDGSGGVWVASTLNFNTTPFNGGGVTAYTNSGVAVTTVPYHSGGVLNADAVAIDASGNVWLSDSAHTLVELVGVAAPVKTPLVEAAQSP